jgi:FixJ family two-component response regulator
MSNRLMVIPGDSTDLRSLQSQLAGSFAVQVIDDSNDALWEVRTTPPDVIIANVALSGMSGMDLAEILPNFGVPTRLILWSNEPNQQAAQQASELGVYRFVTAPLSADELHAAIRDAHQDAQAAAAHQAQEEEAAAEVIEQPEPEAPRERNRRLHDVPPAPVVGERSKRLHDVAPAPQPAERTKRLHDVAPAPQPAERTKRMHDVAPAPTLAERARRAAQEQPAAATASADTSAKPAHTRQGALVLTAELLKPIQSRMEALEREFGSQCIMLADRAGMLLAECGSTAGLPTMILLPLLSTSFSTAGQISQMLREKDSSALYVHEGANYDVYCFDVLQKYMLVIVFSKSSGSQSTKIGSVWVYAKRAIRDIEELLG